MKSSIIIFIVSSFYLSSLLAWEVDNITRHSEMLHLSSDKVKQTLDVLNEHTNELFSKGIKQFNSRHYDCNKPEYKNKIYRLVKNNLGSRLGLSGALEEWVDDAPKDVTTYKYKRSLLGVTMYGSIWSLGSSINLNGHVTGSDKLGHFFDQGFDYYDMSFKPGRSGKIYKALQYGNDLENGVFGIKASGIKSYADMSANFSGMTFWMSLLHGKHPYLKCFKNGQYQKIRKFNWGDYVNDSWDEGINCNEFKKSKVPYRRFPLYKIDTSLETTSGNSFRTYKKSFDPALICPASNDRCSKIAKINCSKYFISPACLSLAKNRNTNCKNLKLETIDTLKIIETSNQSDKESFKGGNNEK